MLRPTPGDPWGVEQHHWNTGAKEKQQLNPGGPSNRQKKLRPQPTKIINFVGAIIESDARPIGVQLKREAKLLTVIGLNTKHADCRIICCSSLGTQTYWTELGLVDPVPG